MKKSTWTYILCIVLVEALGFTVGMMTREGTAIYAETINKPPLSPPGIIFPIAWTILYALMGISVARVILSPASEERKNGVILFGVQLALNLAWCFIFFSSRRYDLALAELIMMLIVVVGMTLYFKKVDALAAKLQIPYIVWLLFATYLNIGVLALN